ncbi:hypothetical protein OAS86_04310 [Gammaproteobacteria bacterium]|nr:hypothetical protein [Gammaproteobacteria bacterium]
MVANEDILMPLKFFGFWRNPFVVPLAAVLKYLNTFRSAQATRLGLDQTSRFSEVSFALGKSNG